MPPTDITLVLSTVLEYSPSDAARVIHLLLARLAREAASRIDKV
jgi:hypothetical protein